MPTVTPPTGGISLWILGVLCLLFFILIRIAYSKKYGILKRWQYLTVGILRGLVFILILVIIIDFKFNRSLNVTKSPVLRIFLDNSVSTVYHQSISKESLMEGYMDLVEGLQKYSNNFQENMIIESFSFGSQIQQLDIEKLAVDFTDPVTDISEIYKKSTEVQPDQFLSGVIIVTDGQITKGEDPGELSESVNVPTYSIGIGKATPMVDINIESIQAPTVGIRGDDVIADVMISSVGSFNERVNVSLSKDGKLISSRMMTLVGQGSLKHVKFQFKLEELGKNHYTVKVTSVRDEINISNNRSSFDIVILKDQFKVALITGAINPNTSFIKRVLKRENHFLIDHFVYYPNGWSLTIAEFWRNKYDLIILDNIPTINLPNRWIKDLERKLRNFPSSLAYIPGQNVDKKKAISYYRTLGIQTLGGIGNLSGEYPIGFTNKGRTHPVLGGNLLVGSKVRSVTSFPPIPLKLPVEPRIESLETLAILESINPSPLFMIGEVSINNKGAPTRTAIFTSDKLWELHLKVLDTDLSGFAEKWLQRTFNWLVKSGGDEELYFRVNKSTFQQGEPIKITGQIIEFIPGDMEQDIKVTVNVEKDGDIAGIYPLVFSADKNHWEGSLYASKPGVYNYNILVYVNDNLKSQQEGSFRVDESQIELDKVYLNKKMLMDLANNSDGIYLDWDERGKLFEYLKIKKRNITISQVIQLSHWQPLMVFFIFLLTTEWIIRRVIGLQ